jgi:hypothetical protein
MPDDTIHRITITIDDDLATERDSLHPAALTDAADGDSEFVPLCVMTTSVRGDVIDPS